MTERADGRSGIDAAMVKRLIAAQFPQWAELAIQPVEVDGWDNRTFHLGDAMTVRLPSGEGYVEQVAKEHRWLPVLASQLPLPIPTPLAKGEPGEGYPYDWSVYAWIDGETVRSSRIDDLDQFATSVGDFLVALQRIDASDGPVPGPHNGHRGGSLAIYDAETRRSIDKLAGHIDEAAALDVWNSALATTWPDAPVWVHGDVAVGNLLARDGQLAAVIDFGCSCVGDPACDLVMAWTFFDGSSRDAFVEAVDADAGTWARARGWALWKALIGLAPTVDDAKHDADLAAQTRRVIDQVIADHRRVSVF